MNRAHNEEHGDRTQCVIQKRIRLFLRNQFEKLRNLPPLRARVAIQLESVRAFARVRIDAISCLLRVVVLRWAELNGRYCAIASWFLDILAKVKLAFTFAISEPGGLALRVAAFPEHDFSASVCRSIPEQPVRSAFPASCFESLRDWTIMNLRSRRDRRLIW